VQIIHRFDKKGAWKENDYKPDSSKDIRKLIMQVKDNVQEAHCMIIRVAIIADLFLLYLE
jgi:hypothetical protein